MSSSAPSSDVSLALTGVGIAVGGIVKLLVAAEPVLASLSYLVAILAGAVTVYYKFKRKN